MLSLFSDYYGKDLIILFKQLVPPGKKVDYGDSKQLSGKYDYLLLTNTLAYKEDIQAYISSLKKFIHPKSRVIVVYFNFLWKPVLGLATLAGLRKKDPKEPNWLSSGDISNFFKLEGFDEIKKGRRFLFPIPLSFISSFINRYIAPLPIINHLCLTTYQIFRPKPGKKNYSVSIIIPARNEEENIKDVLNKMPKIGTKTEVIFIEGHSIDNTFKTIQKEIGNYKGEIEAFVYRQKGEGKADAVRLGFKKAKNDILMILDADLTVDPKDLLKFYNALSEGQAEFANGSRLIYPMESQAMRTLNYLGNKIFSIIFTFLLGQRIKDTLCGTKALFKKNYLVIEEEKKSFGNLDPFGDFDLLFGATKLNLKITEVPVRYKERRYGKTNINRFTHGWQLLKMAYFAAKKIKFQ